MILVTKWFGAFLCMEGAVKRAALFPKDPGQIADRLARMQQGEVLDEELELASGAKQVVDRRLSEFGKVVRFDSGFLRPEDFGFSLDLYRQATIDLAKKAVKSSVGPDAHLGHAVRAYDELVETCNILSERLHEWYGLHFPELSEVLPGDSYVKAIATHGSRDTVVSSLNLEMDSIGSEIAHEDLESIRTLAETAQRLGEARGAIEGYVDGRMKEVAPNVAAVAGPMLGARLITKAGSLKRLASLPSGTIQLLGAEKAMFRHLKEGSAPPKHGILFTHPLVHTAPYWQRGAIARALAAKLCLAARADAYTRNDISGLLNEQLESTLNEIRKRRQRPPKKRPGTKRRRHGGAHG